MNERESANIAGTLSVFGSALRCAVRVDIVHDSIHIAISPRAKSVNVEVA